MNYKNNEFLLKRVIKLQAFHYLASYASKISMVGCTDVLYLVCRLFITEYFLYILVIYINFNAYYLISQGDFRY